jgi:2-amino-4-deoxychorismate synthase
MKDMIDNCLAANTPFCMIQKQDSEEVLILSGETFEFDEIDQIPRVKKNTNGEKIYDTISVIPFCQVKERGYRARSDGEKILTIRIEEQYEILCNALIEILPHEDISLMQEISYDTTEEEYEKVIQDIIEKEIGNGEGANFVIPRNVIGHIANFGVQKAFSIFRSLLINDYGTYWKFIFYNGDRFFVGSTPERHLYVGEGRVKMNPISGTFRKDKNWSLRKHFKKDLLSFLKDQKEVNELFMVVDEELKMMAKMCGKGGSIVGPLLKEMSQLIHSEYLLSGESDKDIFELFRDSMFAATVVGSPVENACNIIHQYSQKSRRYYGSAMMLVGRDEDDLDFLDSPITIRTAEIDKNGKLNIAVGATLVRDSNPVEEVRETQAKSAALLRSITQTGEKYSKEPLLTKLQNDDEIVETMVQRNQNLSNFWFFKQEKPLSLQNRNKTVSVTIIHNEDDFVYMLQHIFESFQLKINIISYKDYDFSKDQSDITLVGPGPGNPNNIDSPKIAKLTEITKQLLAAKKKSMFVCLGHQLLCKTLGFDVPRKDIPHQGVQEKINLFGEEEIVGFYNTFVPKVSELSKQYEISFVPEKDELVAIKGEYFVGFQFHPESILTKNGYTILKESLQHILAYQH